MPRVRDLLRGLFRSSGPRTRPHPAPAASPDRGERSSPGRSGPYATTDARRVAKVQLSYAPNSNGDPDPGEIVWTWVPYEENDGRGKDRPILVVAREPAGTLLAVQLSSRHHDGDPEWVPVGTGDWDGEHRPSWADTGRVLRVHAEGVRREASALSRSSFNLVIAALRERHGWV